MAYLVPGGTKQFRHDTDKVFKLGFTEKRVSGRNLVPIVEALSHYEAVLSMGGNEQQKALCSILSRANTWFTVKSSKVRVKNGLQSGTTTLAKRSQVVQALMNETMGALNKFHSTLTTAMTSYLRNKNRGARPAAETLARGYANERNAYLMFNKSTSLSASIIDDYLFKRSDRNGNKLPKNVNDHFQSDYRAQHKDLVDLTLDDWRTIHQVAGGLQAQQIQVRYMKKHERLMHMLESDNAGGLRFVIGPRPADSTPNQWPYAIDAWGNLYTANDRHPANVSGYAMFNHSTFTAGDDVVCAGMLRIDAAGQLTQIDNGSGHYKPTREQLKAALSILEDDYGVDLSATEIVLFTPVPGGLAPKTSLWDSGHYANFLADGNPDT